MEIIKKKKLKQLKACRKACQRIYDILTESKEDEHGNIIPYRDDKAKKEILEVLNEAGFGQQTETGFEDWEYPLPWPVERRKA